MAQGKTVLIVDDHPLFREGVKSLVGREKKYVVVAEAENGAEAVEKAKEIKPAIILMDLSLPDMDGFQVLREIKRSIPETAVVMLTMHSLLDNIVEAFRAGASGYVVKDAASESLLKAMDAAARGEYFMDAAVSRRVIEKLLDQGRAEGERTRIADDAYDALTPREQEIMGLLADGLKVKTIAEKLCISAKTVENHRSNIMRKLDLHSGRELVKYAARLGLIDVDLWKV